VRVYGTTLRVKKLAKNFNSVARKSVHKTGLCFYNYKDYIIIFIAIDFDIHYRTVNCLRSQKSCVYLYNCQRIASDMYTFTKWGTLLNIKILYDLTVNNIIVGRLREKL